MINMRFSKRTQGAISIFLVLIMLPMFTCAGLMVDGARISAARTAVTGAGDLTMNAALSEYETTLQDVYGLFAMSDSTEELQKNVSRYFNNTINNTGVLQGSDSYTRSFINSIGSWFSTDDIRFDNIVDTQVVDFSLVEVSGSALGNPAVLDRQIVEYMKYRGPVNIGTGLLTKLGCIGETSKQTKALEAKVNYEKKLDSVQDACETAYNAINTFNSLDDSTNYKEDYLTALNNDLEKARELTKEMVEYIIAAKSPSFKVDALSEDSDLKKSVNQEINNLTGDNKNLQAYNLMKEKLKTVVEFEVDDNGNYKPKDTEFYIAVKEYFAYSSSDTLLSQAQYAEDVKINYGNFKKMYTYLHIMDNYYDKLTKEERNSLAKENEAYAAVAGQLVTIVIRARDAASGWKDKANEKGREAAGLLYDSWYSDIDKIDTALNDAIEALEVVLKRVDALDSERTKWKNSVNNLSDSDIKTSMQGDYENSAKDINKAAVNSLISVLTDNKTHFNKIKEKLDSVKLYDKKICIENSSSINYNDRFSAIPASETRAEGLLGLAQSVMNNYTNADVKTGITPATFQKITEDQEFYKYLKNMFTDVGGNTGSKKTAKENRKALLDQANKSSNTTATESDTQGVTKGSYITEQGLTSAISDAIDKLANGVDTSSGSFDPKSMDADGSNSNTNLSKISELLENLSNVAEIARDKVYLEEYITEMFSCYTSGKGPNGAVLPARTLSNQDMTTNKFYRSEVEYILWGHDSVETNLSNTKALIFGIRFALNSIYALTSTDTRTPALAAATAIAGWTGFGVPIVQTVILMAWAMAESAIDLEKLCAGEAVCIYKSKDTWVLGIGGLKEGLRNATERVVDDVFEKINDLSMDSIQDAEGYVENYVKNTQEGVVDSVKGSIMSAVESLLVQVVGESNYNLKRPDIEKKVDEMLVNMEKTNSGDGIIQSTKQAAINAIRDSASNLTEGKTPREYLIDKLYSAYTKAKEGTTAYISGEVENILNKISDAIVEKITDAVSSCGNALKAKVNDIIDEGGDLVKEKITSAIDDFTVEMGGTSAGGKTSLASAMTLTYKEYLKAFILINVVAHETAMLKRCAKLIQANVSQKNSTFDISKAYTMVEVKAEISIRTTFFNVPVETGVDANGNTMYDLNFSNIGTGRQNIKYVGILSY